MADLPAYGSGLTLGVTDGLVDQPDYDFRKSQFGLGSGGVVRNGFDDVVPNSASLALALVLEFGTIAIRPWRFVQLQRPWPP
jgi:hypothetical protein